MLDRCINNPKKMSYSSLFNNFLFGTEVGETSWLEHSLVFNNVLLLFPSGLQVILPEYLQEHFVQAALSYIACNSEGEFICKDNDCWCQCGPKFPECNCPYMDIQAMEENLLRVSETWNAYNNEFEESGEFYQIFVYLIVAHKNCLYNRLHLKPPEWFIHLKLSVLKCILDPSLNNYSFLIGGGVLTS